jgi:hypothetical protein
MNRRELLKYFPVAIPMLKVLPETSLIGADTHRGFKLWWSGWQKPINQLVLMGHWVACKNSIGLFVYSAYPGATGKAWPGQLLNVACYDHQEMPMPWHTEEQLNRFRADAYMRLISYIDQHYEEFTREPT